MRSLVCSHSRVHEFLGKTSLFPPLFFFWCQFHQHFTCGFFLRKFFCEAFLYLHFRFALLLSEEYWRKCTYKMLVKLPTELQLLVSFNHEKMALHTLTNEKWRHFKKADKILANCFKILLSDWWPKLWIEMSSENIFKFVLSCFKFEKLYYLDHTNSDNYNNNNQLDQTNTVSAA
jgi:hypothetical protein